MNAATAERDRPQDGSATEGAPLQRLLDQWLWLCNDYRQRERRELIEQKPSRQKLAGYRDELKWLLRSARALQGLAADPEYPAPQYAAEISGKLLQLQSSWEMLNNPMTEADADVLLGRSFPDESRTGSPA